MVVSSPEIIHEAYKTYILVSEIASKALSPEHPTCLAVALNFSLFYNKIMKEPDKAVIMQRRYCVYVVLSEQLVVLVSITS